MDQPAIPIREHAAIIGEIHHRMENNLQVLSSLAGIEASRTTHPELAGIFREMQNRIRAVANLYDPRYSIENFSTIHFGHYLNKLARELESSYDLGSRVRLEVSADDMALDADMALPLALLSNELISNAFQRALSSHRSGNIAVTLRYAARQPQDEEAQFGELSITDDDTGIAQDLNIASAESTRFYLVRILTQQVKGTVERAADRDTSIRIRFPLTK